MNRYGYHRQVNHSRHGQQTIKDRKRGVDIICDSEDIVIAVVGKLAHGKTSFIEFLANPDENEVLREKPGYDVPAVTVRRLQGWYQDRLVFIDTPGFGEPDNTLEIVVDNIKKCLHTFKYKQLAGIIYLYAFNNQNSPTQAANWPTEAPTRAQFVSMGQLCPQDRITFATCDWARPSDEAQRNQVEDFIEKRKKQTGTAKWREFLSNQETARAIVSEIVENTAGPPRGSSIVDLSEPGCWDHLARSFKLKNIICIA
ncbi:hypothetical protein BJ165DRAFT_141387 [Panaeolus papilionaceus]|nr:hypothetical protein BJ165DRAFT_141387 [Panaeolus papilionaceus]